MVRAFEMFPSLLLLMAAAASAAAQEAGKPWDLSCERKVIDNKYYLCEGQVEFLQGGAETDTKVYADRLEWFRDEERAIATGNVVFKQGRNQIAADRAEFNTKTRLGTFYHASGIANIRPPRQAPAAPGALLPPTAGEETDVYFFGDTVEKIAPKKYTITNGGFTTCVQPTPRWDLHASSITLNVDDYALLWNTVFNVKGVPLLYLPLLYYPTNKENRSTGFLLPTYGRSTLNGQTIGNQFFWAIDRSQDATFMHDWFSRLGQGAGAEYRYNAGSGRGDLTSYILKPSAEAFASGLSSSETPSFFLVGSASQTLPHRLQAQGRVNYFSSLSTNRTFKTDIRDLGVNRREYGGNVLGSWGRYSFNGKFDHTEWFGSPTSSAITGSSPQVFFSQGERPLFSTTPMYFGFTGDLNHIDRQTWNNGALDDDRTLTRIDLSPRLRYPITRWQWLTINSSLLWRDTLYTRSQDPVTSTVLEENLNRQFFTFQADVAGPVFNRVWDTPDNGYAEKFKHTLEPFVSLQRTTSANDFGRVVAGVDVPVVGGTTNLTYGLNNRLHAKRKRGQVSQSQEIASVAVTQTYYTDSRAAQVDPNYTTSFTGAPASHFSPVRIDVRASPAPGFSSTFNAEIDPTHTELRTLRAGARHSWSGGYTDVGWSQRFFIKDLPNFDNPDSVNRTLDITSNGRTRDNHFGGTYRLTFDAVRTTILQQSVQAYYSAQCCGVSLMYARTSYPGSTFSQNNTFQLSFTLAGIGTVSPFSQGGLTGMIR